MKIIALNTNQETKTSLVGGKAASLIELISAGVSVPAGFVITTEAAGIMDETLQNDLYAAFDALAVDLVAVRSSATAEDGKSATWAGQLDTYLNVSRENLIQAVEDCWQSVNSARAQTYAKMQDAKVGPESVGVVIQEMVQSEVAGVAFSVNPITQDASEIIIEAAYGLGEAVVSGSVTPDNYVVKKTGEVLEKHVAEQAKQLIYTGAENEWVTVDEAVRAKQKLDDEQIAELLEQVKNIEAHFGFAVDIEWALSEGQIYITQSRPITTLT